MKEVKVNRQQLLKKLKDNRDKHVQTYEKAYKDYVKTLKSKMKKLVTVCDKWEKTRRKFKIDASIDLHSPHCYKSEYDTAIEMVAMSVDDELVLTQQEFKQYVTDEWGWKHSFSTMASTYSGLAKRVK